MKYKEADNGGVKMKDEFEEDLIDLEDGEDFYINEQELLENDEIDNVSEAFLRGYKTA